MSDLNHDPYHYARDHDAGPRAWCVRGPKGFKVVCDQKDCAYMLGKLLSGKTEAAAGMAADFVKMLS